MHQWILTKVNVLLLSSSRTFIYFMGFVDTRWGRMLCNRSSSNNNVHLLITSTEGDFFLISCPFFKTMFSAKNMRYDSHFYNLVHFVHRMPFLFVFCSRIDTRLQKRLFLSGVFLTIYKNGQKVRTILWIEEDLLSFLTFFFLQDWFFFFVEK